MRVAFYFALKIYPVSRTRLPGIDEFFHGNLCGRIFSDTASGAVGCLMRQGTGRNAILVTAG